VNIWKENILEKLELGNWEFMLIEKLLVVSKREFGGEDNKSAKVAKLKQVEQGS